MIEFNNIKKEQPYMVFKSFYNKAKNNNQKNIDAVAISTFNQNTQSPDSRYVNIKYINGDEWIFFTNYNSPKSIQIDNNCKISALFFWNVINVQIRIRAIAKKTDKSFSDLHFKNRDLKKNALAICSNQSKIIQSYKEIQDNHNNTLSSNLDCSKRPEYWGGFSFSPYYFEFWEGHESRINKRVAYNKENNAWNSYLLAP